MKKTLTLRVQQPSIRTSNEATLKPTRTNASYKDKEQHRAFFDGVAQTLGVQKPEEWCNVKMEDIEKVAPLSLLNHYYEGSLVKALHSVYPEHVEHLQPWKFSRVPNQFWKDNMKYQRLFFDWLKHPSRLNITSPDDWYRVRAEQITSLGGGSLIRYVYRYSMFDALCHIYPEHKWNVWKFTRHPKGFWTKGSNVLGYLNYLQEQFGIKKLDDWYNISNFELPKSLLKRYGGLIPMLAKFYPQHPWRLSREGMPMLKTQSYLQRLLQSLFPSTDIRPNYRHPALLYSATEKEMELDVYLPEYNLAFEYQGQHHYEDSSYWGDHTFQIIKDTEKQMACAREKITLITVPYWWDRSVLSLTATILEKRSDLMPLLAPHIKSNTKKYQPIPIHPPSRHAKNFLRKKMLPTFIDCKGKPRKLGFDLSSPTKWSLDQQEGSSVHNDPTGWWLVESYSTRGVYVCFDGRGNFHLRNKSTVTGTTDLTDLLPKMYLEGHLFADGKTFNQVYEQITKGDWSDIKFQILDAPTQKSFPFEERLQVIQKHLNNVNSTQTRAFVSERTKCEGTQHLQQYIKEVESRGNTVLLRKPSSMYAQQFGLYSATSYDIVYSQVTSMDVPKKIITCKIFGGKTIQLPLNTEQHNNKTSQYVITPHTVKVGDILALRYPDGEGSAPVVIRNERDNSWDNVVETSSPLPYRVTKGRGQPRCRACKKIITDKEELRIEIRGAFTRGLQPYAFPAKYAVCFDAKCFSKLMSESQGGKSTGMFIPAFHNTISIPESHLTIPSQTTQSAVKEFEDMGIKWYVL